MTGTRGAREEQAMDWRVRGVGLRVGGHRGAAALAPENTYAGFALAAEAGADYLELDVQLSADGVAVVIHDDDLDRTTDGHGPVAAASWAVLRHLDAGTWFDRRFAGQRIPTLSGFLRWLVARPPLGATIEAKGAGSGAAIATAILASPARLRLSICSFTAAELRAASTMAPDVPRLLIVDRDDPAVDLFAAAAGARATGINVPWPWLSGDLVERLHGAGLLVVGGTLDDPAEVPACLRLGLDAVDSNRPAVIVAARSGG
jgi:glycerophosphoryl diester phosphodiesterase